MACSPRAFALSPVALAWEPTAVLPVPEAVAPSPTAVASAPLAVEFTPHSSENAPPPTLHGAVASAQAGVAIESARMLAPPAPSSFVIRLSFVMIYPQVADDSAAIGESTETPATQ